MPSSDASCRFNPPLARLPGLEPATICPAQDMREIDWLFQVADYLPRHLPRAGGSMEQPVWIMDAAELINAATLAYKQAGHGAEH